MRQELIALLAVLAAVLGRFLLRRPAQASAQKRPDPVDEERAAAEAARAAVKADQPVAGVSAHASAMAKARHRKAAERKAAAAAEAATAEQDASEA